MESKRRKLSLFAQSKLAKKNIGNSDNIESLSNQSHTKVPPESFGESSRLLTGGDKDDIHKDNVEKLSKMSAEEILIERQKLLQDLDPGIIEFLKSRKEKIVENGDYSSTDVEMPQQNSEDAINCDFKQGVEQLVLPEVITDLANKWPHMDIIEEDKLKWIEDIESINANEIKIQNEYNARFDFEGNLLDYTDEDNKTLGLYHHGEEPNRPGYTLQELLHLSRSNILQQRIISLNTIANILHKSDNYNQYINESIKKTLINNNIYLILRFNLDDNTIPILAPTLHAIKELFINYTGELCLDQCLILYNYKQPNYNINLNKLFSKEKEIEELKDEELIKLDLIKGTLIRTNLLQRLNYIINNLNPDSISIYYIVQILIRCSRHSNQICQIIIQEKELMKKIYTLLINTKVSIIEIYTKDIIKLYRLLFTQNIRLTIYLLENYDITSHLIYLLHEEISNIKLIIECFNYFILLFTYKLKLNLFNDLIPIIIKYLNLHFNVTNITNSELDLQHCTVIIYLINLIYKKNKNLISNNVIDLIIKLINKFLIQISNNFNYNSCLLISQCLEFLILIKNNNFSIKNILLNDQFQLSLNNLYKYSWLLSKQSYEQINCLPQLNTIPMLIHKKSIFSLLLNMFKYLLFCKQKDDAILLFTRCHGYENYINKIINNYKYIFNNVNYYYSSYEIEIIIYSSKLYNYSECSHLDHLMHKLNLILVSVIQNQDKHYVKEFLNDYIFEEKYFQKNISILSEQMMNIDLNNAVRNEQNENDLILEAIKKLSEIKKFYQSEFNIQNDSNFNPTSLTLSDNGLEPVLPCDWMYFPILKLYDSETETKTSKPITLSQENLTLCLQWILILEDLFSDIMSKNSTTARYCRLSCTFLADNDLFRNVTNLLHAILQRILKHPEKLDFNQDIEGLASFYDFYRELIEQFAGVSYGDSVFGEFILVPLHQKNDKKYKQLLWSEQAAALRFLSTPIDNIGVPLSEFLIPCETEPSLLNTYLFCLATGKIRENWCPVLYIMALHHVSTFVHTYQDNTIAIDLKKKIDKLGNQELKEKIINYKCPS